jgi:hypothetical protein
MRRLGESESNEFCKSMEAAATKADYAMVLLVLPVVVFAVIGVGWVFSQKGKIQDNWIEYRCHPAVIPVAGMLFHDGTGKPIDTVANAQFCVGQLGQAAAGGALEPVHYLMQGLTSMIADTASSIDNARGMISRIRTAMTSFVSDAANKMAGAMGEIVELMARLRDIFERMLGTGALFAALTTTIFGTMEGMFNMLIGFVKAMVYAVFAMSVLLSFIFPEFLAFSITLAAGMGIAFCFDEDTFVRIEGYDGPVAMKDVSLGTVLLGEDGSRHTVEGVMQFDAYAAEMYELDGILVSGCHKVFLAGQCIYVRDHPDAIRKRRYDPGSTLCCFITDTHRIPVGSHSFTDYEEHGGVEYCRQVEEIVWGRSYGETYNSGLSGNTRVIMKDMTTKDLRDVRVGDTLLNGVLVNGVVELDAEGYHWYNYRGLVASGHTWVMHRGQNQLVKRVGDPFTPLDGTRAYTLITNKGYYAVKGASLNAVWVRDYLDTHDPVKMEAIDALTMKLLSTV